jgi:DNA-binding FrmR family transcriptional regulator
MNECCKQKSKPRDENNKKDIMIRMNKIIGQMNGIKKMIEDERYCDDILIQLSAIDKSIKSVANIILDEHMHTCLVENIKNEKYEVIDEIVDLFKRFQ